LQKPYTQRKKAVNTGLALWFTLCQGAVLEFCRAFIKEEGNDIDGRRTMGSLDKSVKEKQLAAAEAAFETFKKSLAAQGIEGKDAQKNATFRALKADVKKARARIRSIDATAAHVAAMKEKDTKAKVDKTAKAKAKSGKAAKAGADGAKKK